MGGRGFGFNVLRSPSVSGLAPYAVTGYHPLALLGVQIVFMVSRGSVASRLHPCLFSNVPAGLKFRGRADRKLIVKLGFVATAFVTTRNLFPLNTFAGSGTFIYRRAETAPFFGLKTSNRGKECFLSLSRGVRLGILGL